MRAHLRVELSSATGEVLAVREADNAVMLAGAQLIAQLFSGAGTAITHMGVGTSNAAEGDGFDTAALLNEAVDDAEPLVSPVDVALAAEAFTTTVDAEHKAVRVKVRGTLPPAAAVGTVREAGLLSRTDAATVLYNRVTFAPIEKGDDHELTLFWDVTFPYGDLQWVL